MLKTGTVVVLGMLSTVACGRPSSSPSSPSSTPPDGSYSSSSAPSSPLSLERPLVAQSQSRVGFGFSGTVSGFPTGVVRLTGGGAFDRASHFVNSAGGFSCLASVLQGPLSISINPDDPGGCQVGQGVRWNTAALLDSTTFKCTGTATDETAATNDRTVVLQADFYRAGDGDDESFTAKMIVSDADI